jgi:uncharacterized membrane protein YhaH (DUF805 family)
VNFVQAVASGFRNFNDISGRASRAEFWYWVLFDILLCLVTFGIDAIWMPDASIGPTNLLATLITLLPGISLSIRRLHDIDRTGWWFLLTFTIIGDVLLIVWACIKGTSGANRYGPDPLD